MTIVQLDICSVTSSHTNKHKWCNFFSSGNDPVFLDMPDIEALDIMAINCNIVNAERSNEQIIRKLTYSIA